MTARDKPVRLIGRMDCAHFRQSDRWKNDRCLKQAKTLYCSVARKDDDLCGRRGRWFKDRTPSPSTGEP